MGYNVLFHNVSEDKAENCENRAKQMLQDVNYSGRYNIDLVHRVGPYVPGAGYPRPIVVKMALKSEAEGLTRFALKKQGQVER